MSAKSYENQIVERVKVLEDERREINKEFKKLKKLKRKQKRLNPEDEEMFSIYQTDLTIIDQEIEALLKDLRNINYKEENVEEKEEAYS